MKVTIIAIVLTIFIINQTIAEELIDCWPLWPFKQCSRHTYTCDTNRDCSHKQICCSHECGTQCRDRKYIGITDEMIIVEKNGLIEKKGCPKTNMDFRKCNPFFLTCKTDDDCRETGHQQRVCCISAYCGTYCADPINSNV